TWAVTGAAPAPVPGVSTHDIVANLNWLEDERSRSREGYGARRDGLGAQARCREEARARAGGPAPLPARTSRADSLVPVRRLSRADEDPRVDDRSREGQG